MFEAAHLKDQLILGNGASAVAVVTLWSRKEKVAESVPRDRFAVMGQLYSPTRGLDPLVRNLIANPSIRHLIVTGRDFSGSGRALADFFERGFERGRTALGQECWRARSDVEAYVDIEVAEDAIEAVRANVTLHRVEIESLGTKLEELAGANARPYGERRLFPKVEHAPTVLPSADSVLVVRAPKVAQAWVEVLDRVMRFGREGATHYGARQKEVLDVVTVVDGEEPGALYLPDYLPFSRRQLDEYLPRVLTAKDYPDTSYTYGQRLRAHFGLDQVEAMVAKLAGDPDRRSAAAVLWDPRRDNAGGDAPCVNHLWARVRGGRLHLTAVIRSNDMFSAWPLNAFALRMLQEEMRGEIAGRAGLTLALGDLVTVSESAHIYSDCWESAQRVVDEHFEREVTRRFRDVDPRGSFAIRVASGRIECEHVSPSGEHIETYAGATAAHIANQLAHDGVVSATSHALYVGRELEKAEIALAHPDRFVYVQDRQLVRLDA
jgi:thymidylate synthase